MSAVRRDVRRLKQVINNVLNVQEQADLVQIINDYYVSRSVTHLALSLADILDTPAKRQVIGRLRKVIPRSQRAAYDRQTIGLQRGEIEGGISRDKLPVSENRPMTTNGGHQSGREEILMPHKRRPNESVRPFATSDSPHWESGITHTIRRVVIDQAMFESGRKLGLSIRGGAEHGLEIYVSSVDKGSVAEQQGLVPGDLILSVNDVTFNKITNSEAIKVTTVAF